MKKLFFKFSFNIYEYRLQLFIVLLRDLNEREHNFLLKSRYLFPRTLIDKRPKRKKFDRTVNVNRIYHWTTVRNRRKISMEHVVLSLSSMECIIAASWPQECFRICMASLFLVGFLFSRIRDGEFTIASEWYSHCISESNQN